MQKSHLILNFSHQLFIGKENESQEKTFFTVFISLLSFLICKSHQYSIIQKYLNITNLIHLIPNKRSYLSCKQVENRKNESLKNQRIHKKVQKG